MQRRKVSTSPRTKELEFKYLYFKIQKIINHKISLSLKYDQLKQPEINLTLIKPIVSKIIDISNCNTLNYKIRGSNLDFKTSLENKQSLLVVYVLLLIRYEYLIQSELNLIVYDLLITKATVCEIIAIRMLREYKAINRVSILFVNPLNKFTTLELAVLTKSKKFLSQPIIIKILDKFYSGDLILDNIDIITETSPLLKEHQISNYKYQGITFDKISQRSIFVPKYQSLVINLKNIIFTCIHILIILNKKEGIVNNFLEGIFYFIGLSLSYEFVVKAYTIDHKFLKKVVWFYMDFLILVLLNVNLLLKLCLVANINTFAPEFYYQVFSLMAILMFPRILSIFNNYQFFNLIILSFKRMMLNLVGLFFLFLSIVIGFYISFISLNNDRSNFQIAYDLLQIFFGFTPAVWTNWHTYNSLGKIIQIWYLFLSQFIISTILAIVLSNLFAELAKNMKDEIEYFKAVNLIIYFKTSRILNNSFNPFKFPILIIIYAYEKMAALNKFKSTETGDKYFTFLNKESDYYNDNELVSLDYVNDDTDASILIRSRKTSVNPNFIIPSTGRRYSQAEHINANFQFLLNQTAQQTPQASVAPHTPGLVPIQSISTLGNFKSASTDSLFIDDLLAKKYGTEQSMVLNKQRDKKTKELELNVVLDRLTRLEDKIDHLHMGSAHEEINRSILDDMDNHLVNLTNIRETSYDGDLILDVDDDTVGYGHSEDTF